MPSLPELQAGLCHELLDGGGPPRMAVYRGNAFGNWSAALGGAYPVVRRIVGEQFFDAMARDYARAHPSGAVTCMNMAHSSPYSSRHTRTRADLPYLADVARLEWLAHRAYYAADAAPFDLSRPTEVRLAPACACSNRHGRWRASGKRTRKAASRATREPGHRARPCPRAPARLARGGLLAAAGRLLLSRTAECGRRARARARGRRGGRPALRSPRRVRHVGPGWSVRERHSSDLPARDRLARRRRARARPRHPPLHGRRLLPLRSRQDPQLGRHEVPLRERVPGAVAAAGARGMAWHLGDSSFLRCSRSASPRALLPCRSRW